MRKIIQNLKFLMVCYDETFYTQCDACKLYLFTVPELKEQQNTEK